MGQMGFFGEDSYVGYDNERVHELLAAAAETRVPETLASIYDEIMTIFQADHPATFLHPATSTHVVARELSGLSDPHRADPVWYLEHLTLADPRTAR